MSASCRLWGEENLLRQVLLAIDHILNPDTALLENLVAITLHRRYGGEVYFYSDNVEVDFLLPEEYTAIQVSWSISDPDTRHREINALLKLATRMNLQQLLIITRDEEMTIQEENHTIQVLPIWQWCLL